MKKLVFASILAMMAFGGAYASDGGVYMETSNVLGGTAEYTRASTTGNTVATRPAINPRRVVMGHRPCGCANAQIAPAPAPVAAPVAVKTYSEVIDHYQVYQPVIQYIPAGTYTQRKIVSNIRPCDM